MMNSTNRPGMNETIDQLKVRFHIEGITIVQSHEIHVDVKREELHEALTYLKIIGFKQLSALTCVDWPKENCFQLIFNVFDWSKGNRFVLRVRIDRNDARFTSVTRIYAGAKYYEREVHEFFGIVFEGNEDALKQLFLESWDDLPPLRKDFNSRAYSDKKYVKREYKTSFGEKGGEPFERN